MSKKVKKNSLHAAAPPDILQRHPWKKRIHIDDGNKLKASNSVFCIYNQGHCQNK